MTGIVRLGKSFICREVRVLELPMLAVTLPEKSGWRQRLFAGRAAQLMARRGVRECIFPEGFPEERQFHRKGIAPVDRLPLLREKAGQWVLAERQARGLCGSVGVAAEGMTADTERAVELLLKKTGRLDLLLTAQTETLQRRLRRETGAALRLVSKEQLSRCETLLDFGGSGAAGTALTLRMEEGKELPCFVLPERLRKELPSWAAEDALCALLRRYGRVTAGEIGVKSRK